MEITTLSDRIRFLHLEFPACTLLPDTSTVYFFIPQLYTSSYPDCVLPHTPTVYFLTPRLCNSSHPDCMFSCTPTVYFHPNCILPNTSTMYFLKPDYIPFVVSIVWSFFILLKIKLCSLIKVSTCVSSIKLSKAKGKIELCGSNWEGRKILKMCKSREPKPCLPVHI